MDISTMQQQVDTWIKTYGIRYFHPMTNLGILMEEVGELARIMVRTYGEQSMKENDKNKKIEDEIADILWVLLAIANQCDIVVEKAFQNNLIKKTNRDQDRHRFNKKINPDSE
jgi:Predicted pyrophosphatase